MIRRALLLPAAAAVLAAALLTAAAPAPAQDEGPSRPYQSLAEEELLNMIQSGGALERAAAARELGFREDPREHGPLLMELAFEDESAEVRIAAVRALGALGVDKLAEPLSKRIAEEEDERVRRALAEVAADLDGKVTLIPLTRIVQAETAEVRMRAAEHLAILFERAEDSRVPPVCSVTLARALVAEADLQARRAFFEALRTSIHEDGVEVLTDTADDDRADDEVRVRALDAIGDLLVVDAARDVEGLISHKDEPVAFAAIRAAGALRRDEFARPLRKAMSDGRDIVRTAPAAWALGRLKDRAAVRGLLTLLEEGDDWAERAAAADALPRIGGDEVAAGIGAAMPKDGDTLEVDAPLRAAGLAGDKRLLPHVLRLTRSDEPRVRAKVALALGGIGGDEAIEALGRLVDEDDWRPAEAAALALGELGTAPVAEHLLGALEHDHPGVRAAAAEGLGRMGHVEAIPAVTAMAADEDLAQVRAVAITALGFFEDKLRDEAALDSLVAGVGHADVVVRAAAARACRRVEHKPTLGRWIEAAQGEEHPFLRRMHLELLADATGVRDVDRLRDWTDWWEDNGDDFEFPEEEDGTSIGWGEYLDRLSRQGVDVAFVFDVTGSMGAWLDEATKRMLEITDILEAVAPSLRVGFTTYRDECTSIFDLSMDREALRAAMEREGASGGGDYEEAIEDGLDHAMGRLIWREHARKVIIVVGDAPPHEQDRCEASAFIGSTRGIVTNSMACVPSVDAFRVFAERGGGVVVDVSDPTRLKEECLVISLGARWREEVERLVADLSPED